MALCSREKWSLGIYDFGPRLPVYSSARAFLLFGLGEFLRHSVLPFPLLKGTDRTLAWHSWEDEKRRGRKCERVVLPSLRRRSRWKLGPPEPDGDILRTLEGHMVSVTKASWMEPVTCSTGRVACK